MKHHFKVLQWFTDEKDKKLTGRILSLDWISGLERQRKALLVDGVDLKLVEVTGSQPLDGGVSAVFRGL